MARQDRMGSRKRRERQGRTPDLGYYLIITNTDATEKCFFEQQYIALLKRSEVKSYRTQNKNTVSVTIVQHNISQYVSFGEFNL